MLRTAALRNQFQRLARPTSSKQQQHAAQTALLKRATDDELRHELVALNRAPILKGDPQRVLPVLEEVKTRVKYVSPNNFRDAVVIANGSGHHDLAVELFVRRFETHKSDTQFAMVDAVVDSAFASGSVQSLVKLADLGAKRLCQIGDDFPTDLSMSRLLWRMACCAASKGTDAVKPAFAAAWNSIGLYNTSPHFQQLDCFTTMKTLVRFVKYSERDAGEMLAFRFLAAHQVCLCAQTKPLQFYVNALRSCKIGKADDQAQAYFDEYAAGKDSIEEVVIFTFLNVLQASKAYGRIASYGRKLFAAGGKPSASVLSVIAQAASEAGATDVVVSAFNHVSSQSELGEAPSKYAAFACLVALGKCGGNDYVERVDEFVERKLIDVSEESRVFLLLQHAVHAADPLSVAATAMSRVETDPNCQTERVFNQLLQLQLRMDAPEFIMTYQSALARKFFRPQWIDLLVTWADRRRYELSNTERKYVLDEVKARRPTNGKSSDESLSSSDAAAGIRPMLSILQFDAQTGGAQSRKMDQPLSEGPKLMDPRVHFLKTRKMNALHLNSSSPPQLVEGSFSETGLNDAVFTKALRILQVNSASELQEFARSRPLPLLTASAS